jgi:formate--tetrahydrofolate ligase
MQALDVQVVLARHWAEGSAGATDLARSVVELIDRDNSEFRFAYQDEQTLWEKIRAVASKIYGASDIAADASVRRQLESLQASGYGHYPVCIAKTQYSFSTDPKVRGAPEGHVVNIREVRLAAGAEFIVAICGDTMTMPGLPAVPSSERIDVDSQGRVVGIF